MVKRNKTAARAGKPKPPPTAKPWVALESKSTLEQDGDSNDGSFLDDDTENLLPAPLKGNTNIMYQVKKNDIRARCKPPEIENAVSGSSLSRTPSPISIVEDVALTNQTTNTQMTITPVPIAAETAIVEKAIITLQLHVPASFVRKSKEPKQEIEVLQAQIKRLAFELNKKDRDLKSAKNEASTLKAKQSIARQSDLEECRKLEVHLNTKHEAEFMALKKRLGIVEVECENTATDLRALRVKYKSLKDKHKEVQRSLDQVTESSNRLTQRILDLKYKRNISEEIINKLDSDLAVANADNQKLRSDLSREQNVGMSLRTYFNNLMLENTSLFTRNTGYLSMSYFKSNITIPRRNYLDQQKKYKEVAEELEEDNFEIERLIARNKFHEQRNYAQIQVQSLRAELAVLKAEDQKQKAKISELAARITDLEIDKEWKSPFVKLATDIRLRYLEYARETIEGVSRAKFDREIILNGNHAAHRANITVDSAIFYLGLVPENYLQEATRVFEKLYEVLPDDYINWSRQRARLMDCRATLLAVKLADGVKSRENRSAHDELDDKLVHLSKVLCIEQFEFDDEVEAKLSKLEKLNDRIVEADRAKYVFHDVGK